MKKISFFLLGLLSLLFISCGGDIKISIFTRDLSDVMNSREEVLYTNVNLIVEGLDDENDIEFLRRNLNGFSNEHKVDYNYSTSLSFDIITPPQLPNNTCKRPSHSGNFSPSSSKSPRFKTTYH